jgi:hypothetical protein
VIDRRQLLLVEALGDMRTPFSEYRPDHGAGIELDDKKRGIRAF